MHLAGDGGPDCGRDLVGAGVLEEVARRAGLERRGDLLLLDEAGHRHDLDVRVLGLDPADRGEPVHVRHQQVHQHDVGLEATGHGDALAAVGRLAHDLDVGEQIEERAQARADDGVVVDEQDADPVRRAHGQDSSRSDADRVYCRPAGRRGWSASPRANVSSAAMSSAGVGRLGQVTIGRQLEVRVARVGPRQDDDADSRPALADDADEAEPGVDVGQLRVDHEDVDGRRLQALHRAAGVADGGDELEPVGQPDERAQGRPDASVGVDDQDPDGRAVRGGRSVARVRRHVGWERRVETGRGGAVTMHGTDHQPARRAPPPPDGRVRRPHSSWLRRRAGWPG